MSACMGCHDNTGGNYVNYFWPPNYCPTCGQPINPVFQPPPIPQQPVWIMPYYVPNLPNTTGPGYTPTYTMC